MGRPGGGGGGEGGDGREGEGRMGGRGAITCLMYKGIYHGLSTTWRLADMPCSSLFIGVAGVGLFINNFFVIYLSLPQPTSHFIAC